MRIGFEITPLTHTPTGVGYYVRHLLSALMAIQGANDIRGFASGIRPLDTSDTPIWHLRLPVPTRALYRLWEYTGFPRVDRMLGGVDVYHAVNYVLPPLKQARGVLSIHDLSFLRNPHWCSPGIVAPFRRGIRNYAQRADVIIACSQATRQDIVEMLDVPPERVRVIYDAADALFTPMDREHAAYVVRQTLGVSPPYLLFVGTVESRKNVETLVNAFARARLPHHLIIAGAPGWGSESVLKRIEDTSIGDRVTLTGYVKDRTLFPALYSGADAFVFPSWFEGFGLPVIEAMACGCPVITSKSSSLPEVGGDAPIYIDPDDSDQLARAMERVTQDPVLCNGMREKGLAQAKHFSWTRCARETLDCYGSMM